jgi:hypothetical protein
MNYRLAWRRSSPHVHLDDPGSRQRTLYPAGKARAVREYNNGLRT